ncbi:MAG: threonylcarbamoyl-AMP synthase [Lactobacillus sp.]|nr:MAG: threonylcarbamoyl-AMP synthase [Lactobacillus sp.]
MDTKIYTVAQIDAAAAQLAAGQLVAFPTETVYGLGADATNEAAVSQVYAAKGRPSDNPLIVHVADVATVEKYAATISPAARQLMAHFWPGSLTMIFKLKPGVLSKTVTGGLQTAAFRFPNNQATLSLIKKAGCPIVGPSANTSGKPSPTTAQHVYHDLQGKIAGILDDGPTTVGVESTVLDMSTDNPVILRPGAVTQEQIEAVIGTININHHHVGKDETPKAPGMKYKHYAPRAQVYIVDHTSDWQQVARWLTNHSQPAAVLAEEAILTAINWPNNVVQYSLGTGVQQASAHLFAGLRGADEHPEVTVIFAQGFSQQGLGIAYMNRLDKSAGGAHFNDKM